jgi:hypothetical protein
MAGAPRCNNECRSATGPKSTAPDSPYERFGVTVTLSRPACALICAAAVLLGVTSVAHADPSTSPAAVQNLESDASSWTSETTTDIDWDDPDGSDPSPIANTLYTVDGSPTSGATWQTSPGDTGELELSGLSDGIHHVWVWLEDAENNQDPSTAQEVTIYIDNTPPTIAADSAIDYDAGTISFPVSDALSGVDPDSVDVEATNPDGSDDEDLGGVVKNGTIVADLPDYADSGNRWTFAVSAADLAGNFVTTSFEVTLKPPPSTGSGGSGGPTAPTGPAANDKIAVVVKGHDVRGHVPTSDQPMAFIVYEIHGKRLKLLKAGRTAKTGDFNLHFGDQISGSFKVLSGPYETTFTIKKAAKAPDG